MEIPDGHVFCGLGELCAECAAAEAAEDDMVIIEHVANCTDKGFCPLCQL